MNSKLALYTKNFGGNLHQTATVINKLAMAEYLIHLHCTEGARATVAVFRAPVDVIKAWRATDRSYCGDNSDINHLEMAP